MQVLADAKMHIAKMLGRSQIKERTPHRLMKYVLRVDYDDKVLLQNVVTGQLVVLDSSEKLLLELLPGECTTGIMKQLIEQYFLVPLEHDEAQKVIGLRKVLQLLDEQIQTSAITFYTILPTTACNARCYYCFEHGVKSQTMSEKTATEVIEFIKSQHKGKHVSLLWFGGEPTVASQRIDQICQGLRDNGISYSSRMISNGYMFDDQMIDRAVSLWNLRRIQITVDGTENNNNRIKSFVSTDANPYWRVLNNVKSFCNHDVYVDLRMNYDIDNSSDFSGLIQDVLNMHVNDKMICVSSHPIIGEYSDCDGHIHHGTEEWFEAENCEHDMLAIKAELLNKVRELPSLKYRMCMAASDSSIVIKPDGKLVSCAECLDENQVIGDVVHGKIDGELCQGWKKQEHSFKCKSCVYFPVCIVLSNCPGKNNCTSYERYIFRDRLVMQNVYMSWLLKNS